MWPPASGDGAKEFLLSERSHWKAEPEMVCALAGVDPEALREKVQASEAGEACSESVGLEKAQLRHVVGTKGCYSDLKINEAETPPLKPFKEGRGWAKMDPVTKRNAYTGS
jgi:hypothetical protein